MKVVERFQEARTVTVRYLWPSYVAPDVVCERSFGQVFVKHTEELVPSLEASWKHFTVDRVMMASFGARLSTGVVPKFYTEYMVAYCHTFMDVRL